MTLKRVGFIGVGQMGLPMARRVAEAGYPLTVFDVQPENCERLRAAVPACDIDVVASADLVAGASTVLLMLPSSLEVTDVVRRLLGADSPPRMIIDMSSSIPAATRELARECGARECRLIDAPVSGGAACASAGTLTIMVGCPQGDLPLVHDLLSIFGQPRRVGEIGAGHAVKALNNYLSAAAMLATAEAVALCERMGLDAAATIETIDQSTGRSWATHYKFPEFVFTERFDSGFSLRLLAKDLGIAKAMAGDAGLRLTLLGTCAAAWAEADADMPGSDHTEIASWVSSHTAVAHDG